MNGLCQNLKYLTKLKELKLSDNLIGDDGIELLVNNFKFISNLNCLDLKSITYIFILACRITSIGIETLSSNLKYIPNITILNLSDNDIGCGIISLFNNLKYITKLLLLNIVDCKIDNNGIEVLNNNLKYIINLKELYLTGIFK